MQNIVNLDTKDVIHFWIASDTVYFLTNVSTEILT